MPIYRLTFDRLTGRLRCLERERGARRGDRLRRPFCCAQLPIRDNQGVHGDGSTRLSLVYMLANAQLSYMSTGQVNLLPDGLPLSVLRQRDQFHCCRPPSSINEARDLDLIGVNAPHTPLSRQLHVLRGSDRQLRRGRDPVRRAAARRTIVAINSRRRKGKEGKAR